jgi:F-type H+-transporting ATPase subunit b
LQDLRRLSSKGVYDVSRKVLKELADGSLEEQIIEVFLKRFQEAGKDELQGMTEGLQKTDNTVRVRSAFEVPTQLRRKITTLLHQTLGEAAEVEYETDGDMILGIELKIQSRKVAWSLGEYLDALEKETRDLLERETQEEKADRGKKEARKKDKGSE